MRSRNPAPLHATRLLLCAGVTLALATGCGSSDSGSDNTGTTGTTGTTGGTTTSGTTTGGDSSPGSTTGGGGSAPAQMGIVTLSVDDAGLGLETALNAFFLGLDGDLFSADQLDAFLDAVSSTDDLCFVDQPTDDDDEFGFDFNFDLGTSLSAGEFLVASSSAGTYTTLIRESVTNPLLGGTFILYAPEGDESIAGAPPNGLTIDIPGDEFPAFADVAIPDVPAALTDFSPAQDAPAPLGGTFTWTPSGVAEARVTLELDGGAEQPTVDCLLVDDGNFVLPSDIAAQLNSSLSPIVADVGRNAVRVLVSGSAALLVSSESDGS